MFWNYSSYNALRDAGRKYNGVSLVEHGLRLESLFYAYICFHFVKFAHHEKSMQN